MDKVYKSLTVLFWMAIVVVYPMLISIYVTLPLFVGFAGLMIVIGAKEDRFMYIFLSLVYMINLEINLSLPLFLLPISVMVFYIFIQDRLDFLKLCRVCIYISTVILINLIYIFFLFVNDIITGQSSVNYDSFILFSIIYDIVAAVLI